VKPSEKQKLLPQRTRRITKERQGREKTITVKTDHGGFEKPTF
jgi:hypothetical protein